MIRFITTMYTNYGSEYDKFRQVYGIFKNK